MDSRKITWASLATAENELRLAVDTEFEGRETLTIQFALRFEGTILVQVYRSPDVLSPPDNCFVKAFIKRFDPAGVIVRPPQEISADLSPARVLADLLQLPETDFIARNVGDARRHLQERNSPDRRKPLKIEIILIGHFLRADLLRAFGSDYYSSLLAPPDQTPSVAIRDSRVIGFTGTSGGADIFSDPIVEYVADQGNLIELCIGTMDTNNVCGSAKLDDLSRSYLGIAKDDSITDEDKEHMKKVFCNRSRIKLAYQYAAQDAVLTLLIAEKMNEIHEKLYEDFSIPSEAVPRMHGTPGLRVANLILQHARHKTASGSKRLGAKTSDTPAGMTRLKELARKGSADSLSDGRVSRYGWQTGDTHGGLLQSRTPFKMFYEAVGQFRDLDLQSCYPAIIRPMVTYFGRPVVLEPGHKPWTLKQAVEYLKEQADGDHSWMVKVSGPIVGFANTLIPSTIDGLTNDNYKGRGRNRAPRETNVARLKRKEQDYLREQVNDRNYTALLTDEVNAGIVTWATVLMIEALPASVRKQYENLRAETIIFYPRKLVASTGPEFDELTTKFETDHSVDWRQELDLEMMTLTTVEDIDEKYVSLRYPVGELTDKLIQLRENQGKDTPGGKLYKTLANTVYGVFASPYMPTSNPVTANVITGTARALAYAMNHALNGLLVITDGVLYRRDRVPADTFASLIRRNPDYPLLHADEKNKFLDADNTPNDDVAFTEWYVGHVLRFFGVEGRPEYESLFRLHSLAHKSIPDGGPAFDGLLVDGSANYAKLLLTTEKKWRVVDMKARSFGQREKRQLQRWLLKVYKEDKFSELPPVVSSGRLLAVRDALVQARKAVVDLPNTSAIVPLGFWQPSFTTYKLIKPSAFVFRTARQRVRILKDWRRLTQKTDCGPELLALRPKLQGSLATVGKRIFDLIQAGEERLNGLNIDRLWRPGSDGLKHEEEVGKRRDKVREEFRKTLIVEPCNPIPLNGLVVDSRSIGEILNASSKVSH